MIGKKHSHALVPTAKQRAYALVGMSQEDTSFIMLLGSTYIATTALVKNLCSRWAPICVIVGMIGRNMTVLANNNHVDAANSIMTKNLPT